MNRRGFLKFLSASAIVAITPLKFVAPVLHRRLVESLTFQEIINITLRNHRAELVANITRSNPLFERLKANREKLARP